MYILYVYAPTKMSMLLTIWALEAMNGFQNGQNCHISELFLYCYSYELCKQDYN